MLVCPCCVNWKRRCFNGRKYRIAFTPIDSIIMALTEPGKFKVNPVITHGTPVLDHMILTCIFLITLQAPDNRCLIRLLKTTSASTNLFTHVLPMHVMHILSGIDLDFTEKVEDKLVLEWWKHNERTEFFNSSATAQAVRLCNKRKIVSDIDIE